MTNSNLLACMTGRSAGLAPFRMRPGINTYLTIRISDVASVAHQPASLGIFTPRIGRGHCKAHRLKGQLDMPAVQEGIAADEEGVGSLARKSREGPIDLTARAGVKDLDLQSHGASCRLHVFQRDLRTPGIVRIDEH